MNDEMNDKLNERLNEQLNDQLNDELEQDLREQLKSREHELDAGTLTRLRQARHHAIATGIPARRSWRTNQWMPVAAAAGIGVLAIAMAIALQPARQALPNGTPQTAEIMPAVEELNGLAPTSDALETALMLAAEAEDLPASSNSETDVSQEDLESLLDLYENLEFYEWLALDDLEGATS